MIDWLSGTRPEKLPQFLARESRNCFAGGSDEQRKWHRKFGRSEDSLFLCNPNAGMPQVSGLTTSVGLATVSTAQVLAGDSRAASSVWNCARDDGRCACTSLR